MATGKGLRTSCCSREALPAMTHCGASTRRLGNTPRRWVQTSTFVVSSSTKKFVTSPAHRQGFDPIGRYSCGYPSAMLKSVRL